MADLGRFGRIRNPIIALYIHTEHSVFKINNDIDKVDSDAFSSSTLSFKTTNDMSDDSSTFSIMLPLRSQAGIRWDLAIGENDIVIIRVDNNESVLNQGATPVNNNNIMVGLVSEVAYDGEYSSNSEMVQITGQSPAKVFSQFKIGMISEIEQQLSGMGWLWDSGIDDAAYANGGDSDSSGGGSATGGKVSDFDSGSGSTRDKLTKLCKQIADKLGGADWQLVLAQCGAEGGGIDGNSSVNQQDNNFSGIIYIGQEGATKGSGKGDGATGNYAHFKNMAYWALSMYNTLSIMNKASNGGLVKAKTPTQWATALKKGGYFEDSAEHYATLVQKYYDQITGGKSSSSTSTGGSSSTSSSDSSSSGDASTASMDAEKANSPNGGVAFSGNTVAGIEEALIERFKPYILLNYDNSGYTIWDFIDYSDMHSWDNYEFLLDSTGFVNFTGSLYQLQEATLRKPFNEMFYEYTKDGISKLVVRRTPFNPDDWGLLDQVTMSSDEVLSRQVSHTAREQYSVFVDNPGGGLLSTGNDSLSMGANPKTNLDLIKTYGYSKMEVTDLFIQGVDDEYSQYIRTGQNTASADKTSSNNEKGTAYTCASVNSLLAGINRTLLTQKPKTYAQELANKANNISMLQASRLINSYISNAYMLSQATYDDIMNVQNGGGQANTGKHALSFSKVNEFIKKSSSVADFLTKSKPYFKNVSDEELTKLYGASEKGSISKKSYDSAIKAYNKDKTGEKENVQLLDADYFQTILYNWYANNLNFMSGTIIVAGNPDIRLGTIFNDDAVQMRYYVESVSHDFTFTEGFTTTIGVTRGLKYDANGDDARFTPKNMWGNSVDYKGGYMGEAPLNFLSFASSDSGDSSSSSGTSFSGPKGNAIAVKAAEYGATFEKKNYTKKSEVYALGGYGERGSTNPLEHSINGNNIVLDCSSFVRWCFDHEGVTIPNTTWTIRDCGAFDKVNISGSTTDGMKIGDLVFLYNCGHIMFYVGGGKLMGWNGGSTNASWDTTGGCAIVSLSDMGGSHDGYVCRYK